MKLLLRSSGIKWRLSILIIGRKICMMLWLINIGWKLPRKVLILWRSWWWPGKMSWMKMSMIRLMIHPLISIWLIGRSWLIPLRKLIPLRASRACKILCWKWHLNWGPPILILIEIWREPWIGWNWRWIYRRIWIFSFWHPHPSPTFRRMDFSTIFWFFLHWIPGSRSSSIIWSFLRLPERSFCFLLYKSWGANIQFLPVLVLSQVSYFWNWLWFYPAQKKIWLFFRGVGSKIYAP